MPGKLLVIIEEDNGRNYKTVKMEGDFSGETVMLLNPGLRLLSKIVNIIADDDASTLIYEAMISGKTIFIPSYKNNTSLTELPVPFQKKAEEFMKQAVEFGIRILDFPENERIVCQKKLITEEYVKELSPGQQLTVKKDALITPLAKDLMRDRK